MCHAAFKAYVAHSHTKPADNIALGQKYDLPRKYLSDVYLEMCMRENPLSVEEGQKIGYETVIRIAHIREEIKSWGNAYSFRERCLQSVTKNLIELKPLEW
jgi:hypothetical protein